jgi:hypothetical protein
MRVIVEQFYSILQIILTWWYSDEELEVGENASTTAVVN